MRISHLAFFVAFVPSLSVVASRGRHFELFVCRDVVLSSLILLIPWGWEVVGVGDWAQGFMALVFYSPRCAQTGLMHLITSFFYNLCNALNVMIFLTESK